jgi:type III restriction enzyme
VEIKGYRGEDAKDKKATMETYWIPGVNNLKTYGRWAFAEFTEVYQIQSAFNEMIEQIRITKARKMKTRNGERDE